MKTVCRNLPGFERRSRGCGFSLFELILVIIVVALVAGIFLGRFLDYQEMAEKSAMEQTAGAVRSALAIQMTGLIARGRVEDIPKLATLNPMSLLAELPQNYVGEYYGPPDDVPAGNWYFDMKSRQLVYLVRHGTHFRSEQKGAKAIHYQISMVYNDGLQGAARKEIGGIVLKEVQPYTWTIR